MHTEAKTTADRLLGEITHEKELFGRFAEREASLTNVVQDRDWTGLEMALRDLEEVASQIDASERRRHVSFQSLKKELGVSDRAGFQLVLSRLPEDLRRRLLTEQRELKACVARVRSLTGSLGYYFRYVKESVEQIISEVLPHTKGRIYSRHGTTTEGGAGPMMLNHSL